MIYTYESTSSFGQFVGRLATLSIIYFRSCQLMEIFKSVYISWNHRIALESYDAVRISFFFFLCHLYNLSPYCDR